MRDIDDTSDPPSPLWTFVCDEFGVVSGKESGDQYWLVQSVCRAVENILETTDEMRADSRGVRASLDDLTRALAAIIHWPAERRHAFVPGKARADSTSTTAEVDERWFSTCASDRDALGEIAEGAKLMARGLSALSMPGAWALRNAGFAEPETGRLHVRCSDPYREWTRAGSTLRVPVDALVAPQITTMTTRSTWPHLLLRDHLLPELQRALEVLERHKPTPKHGRGQSTAERLRIDWLSRLYAETWRRIALADPGDFIAFRENTTTPPSDATPSELEARLTRHFKSDIAGRRRHFIAGVLEWRETGGINEATDRTRACKRLRNLERHKLTQQLLDDFDQHLAAHRPASSESPAPPSIGSATCVGQWSLSGFTPCPAGGQGGVQCNACGQGGAHVDGAADATVAHGMHHDVGPWVANPEASETLLRSNASHENQLRWFHARRAHAALYELADFCTEQAGQLHPEDVLALMRVANSPEESSRALDFAYDVLCHGSETDVAHAFVDVIDGTDCSLRAAAWIEFFTLVSIHGVEGQLARRVPPLIRRILGKLEAVDLCATNVNGRALGALTGAAVQLGELDANGFTRRSRAG